MSKWRFVRLVGCIAALLRAAMSEGQNVPVQGSPGSKVDIYMGGFFAFKRSPMLSLQPEVAQKALDHVNILAGILDGYRLQMRWNWTGAGDPEESLRHLYTLAYTGPPVPIAWGPIISTEAVVVNQVASRYNVVQVGLTSSETLADRYVYPYTVRAIHTAKQDYTAKVKVLKKMGWRRVAFIYEESPSFAEQMKEFRLILEANDMQVVLSERVKDLSKLDFHLQSIKRQDARIIFTGFFKHELLKLFCQAYISGVYGAKYVWVAPIWAVDAFWLNAPQQVIEPCTQVQITSAVNSTLLFNGNPRRVPLDELNFNGVTPLPDHYEYYNNEFPDEVVLYYTYDGIKAIALALNASIADLQRLDPPRRLEDFSYSDEEMARVILKNADNLNFTGLLGQLLIEDGQRQSDMIYLQQAQGEYCETVMVYVTNSRQLLNYGDTGIKWQGGHVPVDGVTKQKIILEISWKTRAGLFSLASVGSSMALVFLFINVRYKNRRAIKMSSPSLSNVTVVGCLLLYASVFASGWDKTNLSDTAIVIKCHVERMLISLGLSLAFGSVFMKTYRIHAIFSLAVKRFKKIDLPDWKLICGVLVIAFLDCLIFVVWIALDRTTVSRQSLEQRLNETEPERELFTVPVIQYCSSEHDQYFTVILYGVKGVLLTFGLFLAWETRNICISQLNDSKYIAASLYIVALTVALTVPTLTVLGDDVNMMFAIPGVAIVITNTSVLLLNFMPKIRLLLTADETQLSLSMMTSQGYGESLASDKSVKDQTNKRHILSNVLDQKRARLRQLVKNLH